MIKLLSKTTRTFLPLTILWLAACQPNTPHSAPGVTPTFAPAPTPAGTITISVTPAPRDVIASHAAALSGSFVFARAQGMIMLQDATGANLRTLVPTNGDTLAEFPRFSPDGKQVAYSFNYFNKDGLVLQDLRTVNTDGSNVRTIAEPVDPKIAYSYPVFAPNGKEIFYTQSSPTPPAGEETEIDRISVTEGKPVLVIKDGRLADISPDGKKILFRRLDPQIYSSSLWIANADGTDAKLLVDQHVFFDIFAARFSPDSQNIAFAGSGEPKTKLPGVTYMEQSPRDNSCALGVWFVCIVEPADAHGLPSDLWLTNLDGSRFERVTRAGADSPFPAWSSDGRYIAFMSEIGMFVVDRPQQAFFQVTSYGGYGGFDWK